MKRIPAYDSPEKLLPETSSEDDDLDVNGDDAAANVHQHQHDVKENNDAIEQQDENNETLVQQHPNEGRFSLGFVYPIPELPCK